MDALLKYLDFIPTYTMNLVALLTSPKAFLKCRNIGAEQDWTNALTFFGISSVIAFLIQSTALDKNLALALPKAIIFWAIGILAIAAVIKFSWRVVGGRATFNSILLTHLYAYSGFILILACMNLILAGITTILYPDYLDEMIHIGEKGLPNMFRQVSNPDTLSSIYLKYPSLEGFNLAATFTFDFVSLYWCIAIWGAYRELNSASKARSLAAFIICGLISVPTMGIMILLTAGGALTTAPH